MTSTKLPSWTMCRRMKALLMAEFICNCVMQISFAVLNREKGFKICRNDT